MSAPRFVVPGATYLLTRRCFGRRLLLRPCPEINQIFKFCLAIAANRTGVRVHAYCVLSNHYHIVATDPDGTLPIFMHWLNEYVAKCVNARLGRWESFWAPGSYSSVALEDADAIVKRLVYTYVNPVAAGLVRSHAGWPGARSQPGDIGGTCEVVDRPEGFFRDNGSVPETAVLRLVPPPSFQDERSSWLPDLEEQTRARESSICAEFDQKGRRFLGARHALRQSPLSRPSGFEPRRGLNPRVATRDKWKRVESLQRLKSFLHDYRSAWKKFAGGDRSAIFPFGTYSMHIRFGVCVNGP
jgi:REP element-mobilizing transposase RayT